VLNEDVKYVLVNKGWLLFGQGIFVFYAMLYVTTVVRIQLILL